MTPWGSEIPNHHKRQFMQHLKGSGWAKAFTLRSSPRVVEKLLIRVEGRLCYRVTDQVLLRRRGGPELAKPLQCPRIAPPFLRVIFPPEARRLNSALSPSYWASGRLFCRPNINGRPPVS
jgi:hypothetical protein